MNLLCFKWTTLTNKRKISDINSYYKIYQDVNNRGNDKPLIFDDWSNPSRDKRNIVYFKRTYVLHLLRKELDEQSFWAGLNHYSTKYFDKLVTTQDYQKAMEESTEKKFDAFFNKWIYKVN